MSLRPVSALVALVGCFAAGCQRTPPPPAPASSASAAPVTSAVLFDPPPADSSVLAGPAPSGATRVQREQAVISLLRGQAPSERFPVIATDDGGVVDPSLRDRLAPKQDHATAPAPARQNPNP